MASNGKSSSTSGASSSTSQQSVFASASAKVSSSSSSGSTKKKGSAIRYATAQVAESSPAPASIPIPTLEVPPAPAAPEGPRQTFATFPKLEVGATRLPSVPHIEDRRALTDEILQQSQGPEIDINIGLNNYSPIDAKGFSEQRPEILAEFNFEPAFDSESVNAANGGNAVAEMLDIQVSARQLRAENINRLMNELRADPDASKIVAQLEARLAKSESETEAEVSFLQQLIQLLADSRRSLSVKSNAPKIAADIRSRDPNVAIDPVLDVIVNILGFSEQGYRSFSDTKILGQLLEDLRLMLRSTSSNLVQRVDRGRLEDVSSFDIFKQDDVGTAVSTAFNPSALRSKSSDEIASILDFGSIFSFLNVFSTLTNFDDRFKIIVAMLSRELRASAGLSTPAAQDVLKKSFSIQPSEVGDDLFDRIIGGMGQSIYHEVVTPIDSSIVRLLHVHVNDSAVLPFEQSIVRKLAEPVIPGQKFYVDSIIKGRQKFDVVPFNNYATAFGTSVQGLSTLIEKMVDVNVIDDVSLGLNASAIMDRFLRLIKTTVDEISSRPLGVIQFKDDTSPAQARDTFTPALLHAAADDPLIKYMLLLYVLMVGVGETQQKKTTKNMFNVMVDATDMNAGTGVPKTVDMAAGIRRAIATLAQQLVFEPGSFNVETHYTNSIIDSVFAQSVADLLLQNKGINLDALSIPSQAADFRVSGLDIIAAVITAKLLKRYATGARPTGSVIRGPRTGERASAKSGEHHSFVHRTADIDDIADDRIFDKLATVGSGDPTFVLRSVVAFLNGLDAAARSANPGSAFLTITPDYFSPELPGLSRFSKVGVHTFIMMGLELFTSFFKAFPIATFRGADMPDRAGTSYGRLFAVQRDDDLIGELKEALAQLTPTRGLKQTRTVVNEDESTRARVINVQSIVDRFNSMRKKFDQEDDVVKKITNILLGVANNLKQQSQALTRFFDRTGQNASILSSILTSPGANEKLAALDAAQVALSLNAIDEHRAARRDAFVSVSHDDALSPFVDDTVVSAPVRDALFSMLRSTKYTAPKAANLRVLSVGLPAGFQDSLYDRVSVYTLGQDFVEFSRRMRLQQDVVRIHVYMKDLLLDDIVFKPQTFIFETGRFVAGSDLSDVKGVTSFKAVLERARTRSLALDNSGLIIETPSKTVLDVTYDGILTADERVSMLTNHIESYLLGIYVRLLTGVDFSEDSFYLSDEIDELLIDPETQALFIRLLEARISRFAGRKLTLQELRDSNEDVDQLLRRLESDEVLTSSVISLTKVFDDAVKAINIELGDDLITFMKVIGPNSLLFGSGARRHRVVAPKVFERIFHIAIDPDDFEIDLAATNSTESGRAFTSSKIANKLFQTTPGAEKIVQRDMKNVGLSNFSPVRLDPSARRELGQLSLQQFFVVIEQLPDLSAAIHGAAASTAGARPRGSSFNEKPKSPKEPEQNQVGRREARSQSTTSTTKNVFDSTPKNDDGIEWESVI